MDKYQPSELTQEGVPVKQEHRDLSFRINALDTFDLLAAPHAAPIKYCRHVTLRERSGNLQDSGAVLNFIVRYRLSVEDFQPVWRKAVCKNERRLRLRDAVNPLKRVTQTDRHLFRVETAVRRSNP